jgi:hypothetical protein
VTAGRRTAVAAGAIGLALLALGVEAAGAGREGLGAQQWIAIAAGVAGVVALAHVRFGRPALVAALVLGLAGATVLVQYQALAAVVPGLGSTEYLEQWQTNLHESVLDGEGGDPWQYRLLSEWMAEPFVEAADALGFENAAAVGFLAFRVVQNVAIFALAWVLFGRLGLRTRESALGLGLIAWAMTQANYDSGLAFNTYTDLAAYLAAGLLILDRRYAWIVPLAALAALNRETSGLIPIMLIATAVLVHGVRTPEGRRALRLGGAALAAFAAVVLTVRIAVGSGDLIRPHGQDPGSRLFYFNVSRAITWEYLFRTLNVVPFVALSAVARWPRELRAIALAVVPAWVAIHLFTAVLAETRLILVPYALVLVPGALLALRAGDR